MATSRPTFLTAAWKWLAMLNYEVDPAVLTPLIPPGVELDPWQGGHRLSLVGFLFLDTRLKGIPLPGYRNFEEVNLRFYVRRKTPDGWRRGVSFVREIVPKRTIALVARAVYEEPYIALPMRHEIEWKDSLPRHVRYEWQHRGKASFIAVETTGSWKSMAQGSEEEFIAEHYWGYTKRSRGPSSEYEVVHPPWRVMEVSAARFEADVAALNGGSFVEALARPPVSAFLAEGSLIEVKQGGRLPE